MSKPPVRSARLDPIHANRKLALAHLLAAHEVAEETAKPPRAFACQIMILQSLGVTETTLRWLVDQKLAEHLLEVTAPADSERRFQPCANDHLTPESCFCLSATGLYLARETDTRRALRTVALPRYDLALRTLFLGKAVVKQFKVPAGNQEQILKAFQEEGWPPQINDPLPPTAGIAAKKRLHDAIHRLNHRQKNHLIEFSGDGTGSTVLWQQLTTD
jgi:hypothetical protein